MRGLKLVWCLAIGLVAPSCESSTDVIATDRFAASLTGRAVRPDSMPATTGSGTFTVTLTSDTTALRYELTFAGLTSVATAAHVHGPAADSVAAEVLVDFGSLPQTRQGVLQLGTSGSATGAFDLAGPITSSVSGDSLFTLLHAGLLYVDVHSAAHPDGELRGQIRK